MYSLFHGLLASSVPASLLGERLSEDKREEWVSECGETGVWSCKIFTSIVLSSLPALSCGLIAPRDRVSRSAFVYLTPNHKWGFYLFIYFFMTHAPLRAEICQSQAICTPIIQLDLLALDGEEIPLCSPAVIVPDRSNAAAAASQADCSSRNCLISGWLSEAVVSFIWVEVKQIWISWYEWKEKVRNYGSSDLSRFIAEMMIVTFLWSFRKATALDLTSWFDIIV